MAGSRGELIKAIQSEPGGIGFYRSNTFEIHPPTLQERDFREIYSEVGELLTENERDCNLLSWNTVPRKNEMINILIKSTPTREIFGKITGE